MADMTYTFTLEQIEEVCKAATHGPWIRQDTPDYAEIHALPLIEGLLPLAMVANADNADFIALARTALPELVARVRELEGETDPYWMNKARELEAENSVLCKALFKFARELCDLADQVLAVTEQSEGGVANG